MSYTKVLLWALFLGTVGLVIFTCWMVSGFYFRTTSARSTKESPDKLHRAELLQKKLIDLNFIVKLDGKVIFSSPDFRPINVDFREQIIWAPSSEALILQVGEEPIWGYHVLEQRPLTQQEILKFKVIPFNELGYEGKLPKLNSGEQ